MTRRKKRISGTSDYILPIGILVGAYFILTKTGLFGGDNGSNNEEIDKTTSDATASDLQKEQAAGGFQTVSDTQLANAAAAIYTAGISDTIDQDAIKWSIIQVNTNMDLLKLIQLFGTKKIAANAWSTCSLLGFNCQAVNLGAFVKVVLDNDHINDINNYLSAQGINYHF